MLLRNTCPEAATYMKSCADIFLFYPDRPDCVQGRLCFMFYSSLKNLKEVYICPAQGQERPVRGQVRHIFSTHIVYLTYPVDKVDIWCKDNATSPTVHF